MLSCDDQSSTLVDNNEQLETERSLKKRCLSEPVVDRLDQSTLSRPQLLEYQVPMVETQLALIPPSKPTVESVLTLVVDLTQEVREQRQEIQELQDLVHQLESRLLEKTTELQEKFMSELATIRLQPTTPRLRQTLSSTRNGLPHQNGRDSCLPTDQQSVAPPSSISNHPPLDLPATLNLSSTGASKSSGTVHSLSGPKMLHCPTRVTYAAAAMCAPAQSAEEMDVAMPSSSSQDNFQPAHHHKRSRQRAPRQSQDTKSPPAVSFPPQHNRMSKVQSMLTAAAAVATTSDPLDQISCLFHVAEEGEVLEEPAAPLHEEVVVVRLSAPTLNAASKREPKLAWRAILRAYCKQHSETPWRILDILPVSPTTAEVFIPQSQRDQLCVILKDLIVPATTYTIGERDLKRRTAAYRGGYFKALRRAALSDFPPQLQVRLLEELLAAPPLQQLPSRHRNLALAVAHDLQELHPGSVSTANAVV